MGGIISVLGAGVAVSGAYMMKASGKQAFKDLKNYDGAEADKNVLKAFAKRAVDGARTSSPKKLTKEVNKVANRKLFSQAELQHAQNDILKIVEKYENKNPLKDTLDEINNSMWDGFNLVFPDIDPNDRLSIPSDNP